MFDFYCYFVTLLLLREVDNNEKTKKRHKILRIDRLRLHHGSIRFVFNSCPLRFALMIAKTIYIAYTFMIIYTYKYYIKYASW